MVTLQVNDFGVDLNLYTVPIILATGLAVYRLCGAIYQLYFSPLSKIPGPWYTHVSGLWLMNKTLAGKRIFAVHELHKKYGPFVRISPTEIAVSDIDAVKQIHSPHDPYRKSDWYGRLTDGINATFAIIPNDAHKARRRAWGNVWSNTNMITMEPVVRNYVNICAEKINREVEAGAKPNLMQWLQFMTTDIIADISYGKGFDMLEKETINPIIQDLLAIMFIGGVRAEFPFLKTVQTIVSYIPHPTIQWFINCNQRVSDYGDQALSALRREVQNSKDKQGNPRPSLMNKLLDDLNNPAVKHKMTMDEIRHEATNNMIAGSDTVTITGTYMMWVIYRHPEVREKLEAELRNGIGMGEITDEKVQELPYMRAVVREVLRLYSAAQMGLPRAVPDGGRLLGGYWIPAGTDVTSQGYTLHRDPSVFEDPQTFKPERWFEPTKAMENSMMPWGGQSRNCLGQHLAMMELRLLAAVMLTYCPTTGLADTCTDESMEFENYFIVKPKSHKCELMKVR
ncbi:hypothetical protein H072_1573 [Dactylellina haptotyla CBS 200.50]|uniref:Cytochrome P450 n=1 Tax=Dactylellina haptotyla (strain CBS 200.50) TaxID=1284197 RepID=S8BY70_DACHA|nr:hypothetical protein H072_1573 [Dactylellina haptotyla CBS 200.50]